MTIGSILLGVALLVLVALFIARPFLKSEAPQAPLTEYELLLQEKETLLDQIQVLDFDHETGKLPSELHALQREKLVKQATAVLQALDAAAGPVPTVSSQSRAQNVDDEIEAAVARLRQRRAPTAPATPARASNGKVRFCSQCGAPTDPGDRFCTQCGHKLALAAPSKTA